MAPVIVAFFLSAIQETSDACRMDSDCRIRQRCDLSRLLCVGRQGMGQYCEEEADCSDPEESCYFSVCSHMSATKLALVLLMSILAVVVIAALAIMCYCRRRRFSRRTTRGDLSVTFLRLQDPLPDYSQYAVDGNATLERDFGTGRYNNGMDDLSLELFPK